MRARDHEKTVAERTFVIPAEQPRTKKPKRVAATTRGFAERLALFVSGVERARAEELLSCLANPGRDRATKFARDAQGWDSATRQGRMAVAFGAPAHTADRLRQLMDCASPLMRQALFRRLAPWHQSLFPSMQGKPDLAVAPAMEELAERLVREATR